MVAACWTLLSLSSKVSVFAVPGTFPNELGQVRANTRSSSSSWRTSTSLSFRMDTLPRVMQTSSRLVPGHSWAEARKWPWAPFG